MPACVAAVRPPWAIESGRITIEGSGFPIDQPHLPNVRVGDARARVVYASSTRIAALVPPGLEGGRTPVRIDGFGARLRSSLASVSSISRRPSRPGCTRSTTRCSIATAICMSPTAARAASRCRCRSSASDRTAPARRSAPASSIRRRWRSGPTASSTCRAGSKGRCIASRRTARPSRLRPTSASRAVWRSIATARCLSAIGPARSSASIARGRRRRMRRVPSSVAAFHLAFGPDEALYVTAPTLVALRFGLQNRPRRRRGHSVHRVRPAAGDRFRSARRSLCRRSARGRQWTLPAAAWRWCPRADARGPEPRGRGVRFEWQRGRLLERHGVSTVTVRLKPDTTTAPATPAICMTSQHDVRSVRLQPDRRNPLLFDIRTRNRSPARRAATARSAPR